MNDFWEGFYKRAESEENNLRRRQNISNLLYAKKNNAPFLMRNMNNESDSRMGHFVSKPKLGPAVASGVAGSALGLTLGNLASKLAPKYKGGINLASTVAGGIMGTHLADRRKNSLIMHRVDATKIPKTNN